MQTINCTRWQQLEQYFQTDSGCFYRIAYGILRHREDALDAVQKRHDSGNSKIGNTP